MAKDDFAADIAEWCNEAVRWASTECAARTRKLFYRIVDLSPQVGYGKYSKGHFIHNWRVGPYAIQGEIAGTTTQSEKNAEILRVIDDEYFLGNEKAVFTNSTEYVQKIEYEGWKKLDGSDGHPAYAPVATALSESL